MSDEEMITNIYVEVSRKSKDSCISNQLETTDKIFNHLKDTIKLRDDNKPLSHEIIAKRNKNEV